MDNACRRSDTGADSRADRGTDRSANRSAVLSALEQYQRQLGALQGLVVEEQWEALQQQLSRCQALRPEFL